MRDKRLLPGERGNDGACTDCGRRHIHTDECPTLKRREELRPQSLVRSDPWQSRDRRIESGL